MISVRDGSGGDLDIICEFNRRMAEETESLHLDAQRLREGVRRVLEDEHRGHYFVAEEDGQVVGQTMVTREWSDWRNGWFWWLESVYVKPEARGRGVFRQLMAHIEDRAQANRACGIRLYVDAENQVAARTYDSLGLKEARYRMREKDFVVERSD